MDFENDASDLNEHEIHCKHCNNSRECAHSKLSTCPLVYCPNKCGQYYHECKSSEHIDETCPNSYAPCINHCNGCKLRIKRAQLGTHLQSCVASVIRCGSFTLRKVYNKDEALRGAKWPDPIQIEREQHEPIRDSDSRTNLTESLLESDYASLHLFAEKSPLLFQRMYGYLIGLKLESFSRKNQKFGFLRFMLKSVKSKIFGDIEAENCIVFNDYEGCSACQVRIRNMEINRFNKLKQDYYNFGTLLKYVYTYEDFVEDRIYLSASFLDAYHRIYPVPDDSLLDEDQDLASQVDRAELQKRLIENNRELLEVMRLDRTLKLNVAKELSCDAFQLQYESYRLLETTFAVDCEKLFRRDEFHEHYALVHNFLMPYLDSVYAQCPFYEYGCRFFEKKYLFMFVKDDLSARGNRVENWSRHPLSADISFSRSTASLGFSFENMSEASRGSFVSLLDLPFDVLCEIIGHLDSITLFNLSMTCKVCTTFYFIYFKTILFFFLKNEIQWP
jgi:hypothetical protein